MYIPLSPLNIEMAEFLVDPYFLALDEDVRAEDQPPVQRRVLEPSGKVGWRTALRSSRDSIFKLCNHRGWS